MLENLTEAQINEAFEDELGAEYSAVDLWPATKTPQCFLIKGPGIGNLVVRMAGIVEGTKTRNLQPTDTDVAVFIMSMSDKGNLSEFKGNLGSNAIKTIASIFDTVIKSISLPKVQTILFRFPVKALQGRQQTVARIINKLIVVRARSRYTLMDELVHEKGKFAYFLAHRKNMDILDIPGASIDEDKFKKVETKVGEVFIAADTGKEVSKAAAVADTLVDKYAKITTASVISKTKISRRSVMNAMYSSSEYNGEGFKGEQKEAFHDFNDSTGSRAAKGEKSPAAEAIKNYSLKDLGDLISQYEYLAPSQVSDQVGYASKGIGPIIAKGLEDYVGINPSSKEGKMMVTGVVKRIAEVISESNPLDIQSAIVEIAEDIGNNEFADLGKSERLQILRQVIAWVAKGPMGIRLQATYDSDAQLEDNAKRYTDKQRDAIRNYTGGDFKYMNNFLNGKGDNPGNMMIGHIRELDSAFENGNTLPKGTTLYRGQGMGIDQVRHLVENKTLYFRNFVSTSFIPLMYGDFGNVTPTVDSGAQDQTNMSFSDFVKNTSSYGDYDKKNMAAGNFNPAYSDMRINVGIVIKGADKVNVIIPGRWSQYVEECEVILPRGTILKVNKITGEAMDGESTGTMLLGTEVVSPEQIDESEEMIDGDKLFETGIVEMVKPSFFARTYGSSKFTEAAVSDNQTANDLLLSLINFDGISDKFYT